VPVLKIVININSYGHGGKTNGESRVPLKPRFARTSTVIGVFSTEKSTLNHPPVIRASGIMIPIITPLYTTKIT
jgi:hypothetical protein